MGASATIDDTLTMAPPPSAAMCGNAARASANGDRTLTWNSFWTAVASQRPIGP